jgi:hypothetical protein
VAKSCTFNVTEHPIGSWIVQQLREAFLEDRAPRYSVLDRDGKFQGEVATMLKIPWQRAGSNGLLVVGGCRSPWQNGVAERWVGSCRRELLDHVIVLNESHLRRLVRDYLEYYHEDRIHLEEGFCGGFRYVANGPKMTNFPSSASNYRNISCFDLL